MNIFHKVVLQGLKKNRTRTLVTIIGVALSAALFTGITTFAVSLQSYMIKGAASKYGSWHVELPMADAGFMKTVAGDERVSDMTVLQNIGYAELKDSKNANKPYLFLSGWDEKAFDTIPVKLISGRLPENSHEVLVPAHLAANGGVKMSVGDTLTLDIGKRIENGKKLGQHVPYPSGEEEFEQTGQRTYTVVGICQRPSVEEYSAPGYTLITKADDDADDFAAFLTLKNPYGLSAYVKDLEDDSYVLNDDVLRFMGLSGDKMIMLLLYSVSAILIILVVTGSVFLIYNAFNISLNERTHQFGILMSVGATAKQLRSSVLFEGFCIGVIGIPLGILMGLPAIQFVITLVEKNFANVAYDSVPLTMVISLPAILASIVVSLITVLISAYIPAKKAANTPVMECIRQTNEIKVEAKKLKTSRFTRHFLGLEGMLALKNFKRNRQRYRSIVLSLTFSVVLFVSSSTFSVYLNRIAENSNPVVEEYDIVFSSSDMEEEELFQLYDQFKEAESVTAGGYQTEVSYPCFIDKNQLSGHFTDTFGEFMKYDEEHQKMDGVADMVFVDDAAYKELLKSLGLSAKEYTGEDDRMIMAGFTEEGFYMQEEPIEIQICGGNGDALKTVRAVCVDNYPDLLPAEAGDNFRGYSLLLIAPYEVKAQFDALGTGAETELRDARMGMTFRSENPGRTASQMKRMIDVNGITADYSLYNVHEVMEDTRNLTFVINLFSVVFVIMITLISIANVFNTVSTNIRLRRRELAMLRSVGMSDRDFNRMMRFECALYGMRTCVYGLPLSVIIACLIYKGMAVGTIIDEFDVEFIFPWSSMIASITGVFLIVFITMFYATSRIKKENIIDALRDEMT